MAFTFENWTHHLILDCTLRDGGYYIDWDFDQALVRKYLSALSTAKIDVIEIGFRFIPTNKSLGAFAYSADEYLLTLDLPRGIPISVMVIASELPKDEGGVDKAVARLFNYKEDSPVDIIRIAIRAKDLDFYHCREIAVLLRDLGYRVCIILMQIDAVELEELEETADRNKSARITEIRNKPADDTRRDSAKIFELVE